MLYLIPRCVCVSVCARVCCLCTCRFKSTCIFFSPYRCSVLADTTWESELPPAVLGGNNSVNAFTECFHVGKSRSEIFRDRKIVFEFILTVDRSGVNRIAPVVCYFCPKKRTTVNSSVNCRRIEGPLKTSAIVR